MILIHVSDIGIRIISQNRDIKKILKTQFLRRIFFKIFSKKGLLNSISPKTEKHICN